MKFHYIAISGLNISLIGRNFNFLDNVFDSERSYSSVGGAAMKKSTKYTAKVPDLKGHIDYSDAENTVWADLFSAQLPRVRRYCAAEYLNGLQQVQLPSERVPSCADMSARLVDLTGWRVAPVPALIGFKTFFNKTQGKV